MYIFWKCYCTIIYTGSASYWIVAFVIQRAVIMKVRQLREYKSTANWLNELDNRSTDMTIRDKQELENVAA